MKIPVILLFIFIPFCMSAQFHTIAPAQSRIGTHRKTEDVKQPVDTTVIVVDNHKTVTTDTTPIQWCHPPIKGKFHVSSNFGNRRNPFGKKTIERHNGLDISAKSGTPIYAMLPGEVVNIGYDSRSGNFIKLRHGNFTISYCHLIRKPNITVGSRVFPGQKVAHVGSTGRSTGPHLHITLKRNGRVLDPAILLDYISKNS